MLITSKVKQVVTTETYEIESAEHGKLILVDYLDESGKAIDCILRDEGGNNIDDPFIMEQAQIAVDSYDKITT